MQIDCQHTYDQCVKEQRRYIAIRNTMILADTALQELYKTGHFDEDIPDMADNLDTMNDVICWYADALEKYEIEELGQ